MPVIITVENIENASAQFWEQMLAMHMEPITNTFDAEETVRCIGTGHVVGSCSLSGMWVGQIEVRLSSGLANEATSAMLMQPVESIQPADTLDATKEIANMIAGTLKSALPRPCSMTVPSAEVESADFCIVPRTSDSITVFFRHESGELMVRVWQQLGESETEIEGLSVFYA